MNGSKDDRTEPRQARDLAEVWIPGHRDGDSEIIVMGIPI
jgi:hypothetical protein